VYTIPEPWSLLLFPSPSHNIEHAKRLLLNASLADIERKMIIKDHIMRLPSSQTRIDPEDSTLTFVPWFVFLDDLMWQKCFTSECMEIHENSVCTSARA